MVIFHSFFGLESRSHDKQIAYQKHFLSQLKSCIVHLMEVALELPFSIRNYSLDKKLGEGAFGCVYKAIRLDTQTVFAVKVIPKCLLKEERDQVSLQREIDSMAYLQHENIVGLHDFFADEKHFYLVIDYCAGGSLMDLLCSGTKLTEKQVANIFFQIVSGIAYCHDRSVVHRDLKPQNILVTTFPNIKISDFGLCGYILDETKMKTFCGSPCYTAPECLNRVQYDGKCADVWSLGVILFEMITGEHPWNVANTTKMIQQISKAQFSIPKTCRITPACDDLIKTIIKVKPSDRPTCEKIINHPWMKLASSRKKSDTLPPLSRLSLPLYLRTIDRTEETKDHGICSPFNGNAPPLPARTCRSRSSQFTKSNAPRNILGQSQKLQLNGVKRMNGPNSGSSLHQTCKLNLPPIPNSNFCK